MTFDLPTAIQCSHWQYCCVHVYHVVNMMQNVWAWITQQKRTCKIMQDSCKIVQESCMHDLHGTCTRYVPFLARFLHYLARSCTYLARNGARFCKRCCKNNYLQVWSFLHHFLQDMCKILQDSARSCKIVQESCKKRDIACTCHASLACKILAQSCMILQVRFCWELTQQNMNIVSSSLIGIVHSLTL